MKRLSLLDAQFLHLEDAHSPMHIASTSILEGPIPSHAELTRLFESKLHLMPRCRQRVRSVAFELGRPVWTDDPTFRLDYHLRRTALPAPGDGHALCQLIGRLMSQALDRERPLWEAWVVDGLEQGRWALILKIHHCMVDGIAGVDLMSAIFETDRDAVLPEPVAWTPKVEPSPVAKVMDAWTGLAQDTRSWAHKLEKGMEQPAEALRSLLGTTRGLLAWSRHLGSTPPLSIEGSVGAHRVYARASVSLDDVRLVRKRLGGTLNDVVLAAATSGYRDLLQKRGELPAHAVVRSLVPVSVRTADSKGSSSNRVSALLLELPMEHSDPLARLHAVQARMTTLKTSHMAEAGEWVTDFGNLAPPMMVGAITRLVARAMHHLPQRSINTVVTNVPGPPVPLYCLSRKILESYPFVPITQGVRTGIAVLTYNGRVHIGVTGDYDSAQDIEVLSSGIERGVRQLTALASSACSTDSPTA